jgi:hypothetical protein
LNLRVCNRDQSRIFFDLIHFVFFEIHFLTCWKRLGRDKNIMNAVALYRTLWYQTSSRQRSAVFVWQLVCLRKEKNKKWWWHGMIWQGGAIILDSWHGKWTKV